MIFKFFLPILFLFPFTVSAQINIDSVDYLANKSIPAVIAEEVESALSYYPELANTPIDFVFSKNIKKAFMVAQPKWYGIFQKKKNRGYIIKMGREFQLNDNKTVPIEDLPENVLEGWIAHELGHIMDYKDRSGIGMMGFGLRYITSKKFLINAEQMADVHAIDHGLGNYLISTKHFILDHDDIPSQYKKRIKRFYLSPEMVVQLIEESNMAEEDSEI
ncbi:MAG: hypothetical protein ACNS60_12200 [Candidatus Cyclobacteriaceae bacterium M2_1C_046]